MSVMELQEILVNDNDIMELFNVMAQSCYKPLMSMIYSCYKVGPLSTTGLSQAGGGGYFLASEDFGGKFKFSFPACAFFF